MKNYTEKDYYGILGLKFDATQEEIKKAFRKATVKFHPDVNKDGAEFFMKIKEAYEVLSDENERKNYDFIKGYDLLKKQKKFQEYKEKTANFEHKNTYNKYNNGYAKKSYEKNVNNEEKKQKNSTSNSRNSNENTNSVKSNQTSFHEENKNFKNTFSDIFSNLFTGKKQPKHEHHATHGKPVDGNDITMPIEISFKEAINGTNRKINVLHTEICPICEGKKFANGSDCRYCKGTGEVSVHKKLNVKIPPHTENNKKIRLAGEGTKGLKGGKNGNLYLVVKITDDSYFKFDGNNVLSEAEITPYEAALGTEKEIKTLNGTAKLKIPQGTSSGQKFRLANEGLFDEVKKIKGHHIVTIKIKVDENLTEREKQLYEQLKDIAKGK